MTYVTRKIRTIVIKNTNEKKIVFQISVVFSAWYDEKKI